MAIDPQIKKTLQQTIYVAARSGVNATGDATYGSPASRLGRVEPKTRTSSGPGGEQTVTTHQILVENSIGRFDRIWILGDDSSTAALARLPLSVAVAYDEKGAISHYVVEV